MQASELQPPPGSRLVLVDDAGKVRVLWKRRATPAVLGGVLAASAVGGLIVWGVSSTLQRAGGLATSLEDAGIAPILALTVSGIAMPLSVVAWLVLRPGAIEVAVLSDDGGRVDGPGQDRLDEAERAWLERASSRG